MKQSILALGLVGVIGSVSVASASPIYSPVGPQVNVAMGTVITGGWSVCFSAPYGQFGPSVATAVSGCTGDLMMLAAAVNGSNDFDLLAWAPKADVMFNTGFSNTPHDANGSGWYFSDTYSWGFAPAGAPIDRQSCDIVASTSFGGVDATTPLRLCWHTGGGNMSGGWRVGAADFLNDEPTRFTKYILTADSAVATPEPGSLVLMGSGIAMAVRRFRTRRTRSA
jgi:hypothetical protein